MRKVRWKTLVPQESITARSISGLHDYTISHHEGGGCVLTIDDDVCSMHGELVDALMAAERHSEECWQRGRRLLERNGA